MKAQKTTPTKVNGPSSSSSSSGSSTLSEGSSHSSSSSDVESLTDLRPRRHLRGKTIDPVWPYPMQAAMPLPLPAPSLPVQPSPAPDSSEVPPLAADSSSSSDSNSDSDSGCSDESEVSKTAAVTVEQAAGTLQDAVDAIVARDAGLALEQLGFANVVEKVALGVAWGVRFIGEKFANSGPGFWALVPGPGPRDHRPPTRPETKPTHLLHSLRLRSSLPLSLVA
jgi:hypothetical protein